MMIEFQNELTIQRYVADLGRAWPVLVVCGGIAPFILSMFWLLIVRFFVGVVTWLTVILTNIFALAITVFFYIKGTLHLSFMQKVSFANASHYC
jgi:hypothetical protein